MGARRSCGQLFSNVYCLSSPVFNYFFFVWRTFHWPLGKTIACHCDLFSILASFVIGDVATGSFPNDDINKGRWTQDKHKIFLQEWEQYGNNCMQIAKVLSTRTPAQIKKYTENFFKQNLKTNSAAVNNIKSPFPPMKKHKFWSMILLHRKNNDSLSHQKTKFKCYARMLVWCTRGWVKNSLKNTFLRVFQCPKVELRTLFQQVKTQYQNHSSISNSVMVTPPTNYILIFIKPFSFAWYVIPLLKTGLLVLTRDLFLRFWRWKHKKNVVAMSTLCYWA